MLVVRLFKLTHSIMVASITVSGLSDMARDDHDRGTGRLELVHLQGKQVAA